LVAAAYIVVCSRLTFHLGKSTIVGYTVGVCIAITLVGLSLVFKAGFTAADAPELFYFIQGETVEWLEHIPLQTIVRALFTGLASCVVGLVVELTLRSAARRKKTGYLSVLHSLLTLFLMTQTRVHNIPLYLLFTIQFQLLRRLHLTPIQSTITSLILSHVSFFALGNSNAISSIDLSNAYNGISGYNILAVGALVFINNWAGPIWWAVSALVLIADNPSSRKSESSQKPNSTQTQEHEYLTYFSLATLFTSFSLLAVMIACTLLRTHLFIWTVFSPKYLYSMAWSVAHHGFIALALCGGFWKLVSRVDGT